MRPLHGIDFTAMGQRRFSHIKFIEIKGPVAKAIMKKQADLNNAAQSFDPAYNGTKDALKILQQKEKWTNPNKLVKIKSKIDPALLPKFPNEILGLADLFEMRDPAEKLAYAASFKKVFEDAGDPNYLIINQFPDLEYLHNQLKDFYNNNNNN